MAKAMWPSAQGRRLPLPRWCPASGSCRRLGTAPGGSGRRGAPRGRDRATGSAATASGAVANRLQSRLRFCTWLACRTSAAQPRVVPVTGAGDGEAGGAPCRLQNWLRRGSEGRVGARRRRGCDRTTRQRGFGFGRALYLVDCSPEPPPSLRRFCPSMRIARIEPSAMPAAAAASTSTYGPSECPDFAVTSFQVPEHAELLFEAQEIAGQPGGPVVR